MWDSHVMTLESSPSSRLGLMRQMNPDSSTVAGYSGAAQNLLILVSGSTTVGAHKVLLTSTEGNFGK